MPRWWFAVLILAGCGRVNFGSARDASVDGASIDTTDAAPVDPDLLVWLPFDDDATSGVGNRGVLDPVIACTTTCPGMATGKHGGAYDFTTDVLQIVDEAALHMTSGTVAMWIFPRSLPAQGGFAMFAGTAYGATGRNTWEFFHAGDVTNGNPRIQGGGDANNFVYADASWTHGTNAWVHIAFTWDGTTMLTYAGGAEVGGQAQFDLLYDGHAITIAADEEIGAFVAHFDGLIDDFRIYRRTLGAAEIAALAQ